MYIINANIFVIQPVVSDLRISELFGNDVKVGLQQQLPSSAKSFVTQYSGLKKVGKGKGESNVCACNGADNGRPSLRN
ncbi:unnamed protein product [Enterobius vermicularis]|uniref:Uncharacterized protein n=1 Tax=Enterobius vermicularis TaxID=51028 RepID=A0A0N4VP18_ENTVE|nr:unnamed protein product [Enterobius vermicularis]